MFALSFLPTFRKQTVALLETTEVPEIDLPLEIENSLARLKEEKGPLFPGWHDSELSPVTANRLWKISLRSVRRLLLQASAIAIVAAGAAASATWVGMRILKRDTSGTGELGALIISAVLYFLLNSLSQIGGYWSNRFRAWVSLSVETVLVAAISKKILRLSAEAFARQSSGNLKVLITSDVKNLGMFLDNVVRNLIPSIACLCVMSPLLYLYAGKAGLIGIFTLILIIPFTLGLNIINSHYQNKTQKEMDALTGVVGEWVKNVRLVRMLSADAVFSARISGGVRKFMGVAALLHLMACIIFGLSTTWWMITAAVVAYSAELLGTPLDLTGFFGSLWLLSFIAGYFTHLPNTIRYFGLAHPSLRRIARFLDEPEASVDFQTTQTASLPSSSPARMHWIDVGFRYPGAAVDSLSELNLTLEISKKLAMVGTIGSGKSTFLKILSGEMRPTTGRIEIEFANGERRDLWEREAHARFRESLATVPQQPYVSSDLFAVNIALADDGDEHALMRAAQLAELEADLGRFAKGLDEAIGESGVNLSGGQRQRLNLARAFYSQRPYLVLDDPLSAVDPRTEKRLMHQLTVREGGYILVTHRVQEIFSVDEVIVLENGKACERGTPAELAARPASALRAVLAAYEGNADE